ncbi:MAG: hypothetical protein OEY64_03070 [Nitrospinota bacterium]|nr:hypothetical protein [Nitrospinota bacterium]
MIADMWMLETGMPGRLDIAEVATSSRVVTLGRAIPKLGEKTKRKIIGIMKEALDPRVREDDRGAGRPSPSRSNIFEERKEI